MLYIATGLTDNVNDTWFADLQAVESACEKNSPLVQHFEQIVSNFEETPKIDSALESALVAVEKNNATDGNNLNNLVDGESESTILKFQEKVKKIIDRACKNDSLVQFLKQMVNNYHKTLRTDSALESALVTFGKYNDAGQKKLSRKIKVSSAAISRGMRPCSSRNPSIQGRPRKIARCGKHGYQRLVNSVLIPKKVNGPRYKPHNLSYLVESNTAA
ncbi:hypothetical protein U1Q18_042971 [Sarracenia purpurea var. burkii]